MRRFFKVDMVSEGWGLMVNEGPADDPRFRVLVKGSEWWMERLATELNKGNAEVGRLLEVRPEFVRSWRHD